VPTAAPVIVTLTAPAVTTTFGKNTSLPVSPAAQVVPSKRWVASWAAEIETARSVPLT